MKQSFLLLVTLFLLVHCKKDTDKQNNTPTETPLTESSIVKKTAAEMQALVRAWTQWTYGRSTSVSPVTDPSGSGQAVGQPYANETFLLAGANESTLQPSTVTRMVSIDLSKYQYVFVPLINLSVWYNSCDPTFLPAAGQSADAFFAPYQADAFDQNDNNLSLILDKKPVLTAANAAGFRVASGVWSFKLDPSQDNGCTAASTTIVTDGYWALIKLTPGTHTIEFSGSLKLETYGNYIASNHVLYTIVAK